MRNSWAPKKKQSPPQQMKSKYNLGLILLPMKEVISHAVKKFSKKNFWKSLGRKHSLERKKKKKTDRNFKQNEIGSAK